MVKKILIIIFWGVLIISALFLYEVTKLVYTPIDLDHVLCEISYGDTGKSIAKKLYDAKVVSDDFLFYLLIRYKKVDTNLKAGHYLFSGNLNMFDTLEQVVSGEILVERITIPEGLSMYRTFRIISTKGIGDYQKYLDLAKNPDFASSITGFKTENLEGFLYPDTYIFGYEMSEENVLKTMVKNFFSRVESAHLSMEDQDKFYNDLILASIVEKEVIYNDEKPIIAGIYLNRLEKNMKLQACPTVTYYLEPEFKHISVLTYSETRNPSPHNTYMISGLPPYPICSPAVSTIFSVLYPEKSPYLFFFADGRGRNVFSRNYEEHIRKQKSLIPSSIS